nr:hypothetical protein [Catenulispora pinistramenti]
MARKKKQFRHSFPNWQARPCRATLPFSAQLPQSIVARMIGQRRRNRQQHDVPVAGDPRRAGLFQMFEADPLVGHGGLRVDLCAGNLVVAHQLLDRVQRDAGIMQILAEGVPER